MSAATMAMTEAEVAKRLCFEDVSVHSPELFSRFEAQRARDAPSVDGLRRCAHTHAIALCSHVYTQRTRAALHTLALTSHARVFAHTNGTAACWASLAAT
jgi:hypothetical protein